MDCRSNRKVSRLRIYIKWKGSLRGCQLVKASDCKIQDSRFDTPLSQQFIRWIKFTQRPSCELAIEGKKSSLPVNKLVLQWSQDTNTYKWPPHQTVITHIYFCLSITGLLQVWCFPSTFYKKWFQMNATNSLP